MLKKSKMERTLTKGALCVPEAVKSIVTGNMHLPDDGLVLNKNDRTTGLNGIYHESDSPISSGTRRGPSLS